MIQTFKLKEKKNYNLSKLLFLFNVSYIYTVDIAICFFFIIIFFLFFFLLYHLSGAQEDKMYRGLLMWSKCTALPPVVKGDNRSLGHN